MTCEEKLELLKKALKDVDESAMRTKVKMTKGGQLQNAALIPEEPWRNLALTYNKVFDD